MNPEKREQLMREQIAHLTTSQPPTGGLCASRNPYGLLCHSYAGHTGLHIHIGEGGGTWGWQTPPAQPTSQLGI